MPSGVLFLWFLAVPTSSLTVYGYFIAEYVSPVLLGFGVVCLFNDAKEMRDSDIEWNPGWWWYLLPPALGVAAAVLVTRRLGMSYSFLFTLSPLVVTVFVPSAALYLGRRYLEAR